MPSLNTGKKKKMLKKKTALTQKERLKKPLTERLKKPLKLQETALTQVAKAWITLN
jgi:hypothetical protein